jgi:D-alanine--poly(phosphoribitol) ligase subunit 2
VGIPVRSDEPLREIEARLRRIFEESLHVEVPSADTDLFATGALDSLGFVELLVRIEELFGRRIELAELEIEDFKSIARIAALLSRDDGGTET